MRVNAEVTAGVSAAVMAALMLAVFAVSVGFGVVLPLLPLRRLHFCRVANPQNWRRPA